MGMDRLARLLELVHPGGAAVPARGAGARHVHAVARALPPSWSASSRAASSGHGRLQLIAFAVFAIAAVPAWRYFARKVEKPGDSPFLNRRAEGYVGRIFTLDKPIVGGVGAIRIDDTVWRVTGPDCPAGSRVKVARAPTGRIWMVGAQEFGQSADHATPARSRSWKCTMPTGLPASATISAVILRRVDDLERLAGELIRAHRLRRRAS